MRFHIREATPADVPNVVQLVQSFVQHSRYGSLSALAVVSEERLAEFVAGVLERGVCYVAAIEDVDVELALSLVPSARVAGALAGFIGVVTFAHPFSGRLVAEELAWWVEREHRNSTIGPRLMTAALTWARERQCSSIRCSSPFGNDDVGRFYESRGFSPIDITYVKDLA